MALGSYWSKSIVMYIKILSSYGTNQVSIIDCYYTFDVSWTSSLILDNKCIVYWYNAFAYIIVPWIVQHRSITLFGEHCCFKIAYCTQSWRFIFQTSTSVFLNWDEQALAGKCCLNVAHWHHFDFEDLKSQSFVGPKFCS